MVSWQLFYLNKADAGTNGMKKRERNRDAFGKIQKDASKNGRTRVFCGYAPDGFFSHSTALMSVRMYAGMCGGPRTY